MTDKKTIWHYPPDLPECRDSIIWISNNNCDGEYKSRCGTWNHYKDGGKNTGSCLLKWAFVKDVIDPQVYKEWQELNGQKIVKSQSNKWAIVPQDDGSIIINSVRYKKASQ